MKELKAYIRIDRIDGVIHALRRAGITHMNVTHVQAIGGPIDLTEAKISVELASRYTNMVKLEIVCPETSIDKIISIVQQEAHTGRPGDGISGLQSYRTILQKSQRSDPIGLSQRTRTQVTMCSRCTSTVRGNASYKCSIKKMF